VEPGLLARPRPGRTRRGPLRPRPLRPGPAGPVRAGPSGRRAGLRGRRRGPVRGPVLRRPAARSDPDRSDLDRPDPYGPGPADGERDYAAAAEGPSAVLSSAVPRPAGSAALVQAIYADDYRGAIVTFSGEIRVDALTGQAGLRLEILRNWWESLGTREDHGLTIASRHRDWTRYEIRVQIPADADLIRFGTALTGPGRIALRNPDLRRAEREAEPGAEPGAAPDAGTP